MHFLLFIFWPQQEYGTVSLYMVEWRVSVTSLAWPHTPWRLAIKYGTRLAAPNSIPASIWPYLTRSLYRNSHVSGRSPHGRRGMLEGGREGQEGGKVGMEGRKGTCGILVLVALGIFKDTREFQAIVFFFCSFNLPLRRVGLYSSLFFSLLITNDISFLLYLIFLFYFSLVYVILSYCGTSRGN